MAFGKGKIDKGQGGKRGQSNKDNWVTHQEEKHAGRVRRKLEKKRLEYRAKQDPTAPED